MVVFGRSSQSGYHSSATQYGLCQNVPQIPRFLPTRVMDVGPPDGSRTPVLHVSHNNEINVQYLALSHYWGGVEAMKLNFKALKRRISLDDLPLTSKHVSAITP